MYACKTRDKGLDVTIWKKNCISNFVSSVFYFIRMEKYEEIERGYHQYLQTHKFQKIA